MIKHITYKNKILAIIIKSKYLNKKTIKEMAIEMKLSESCIKMRLSRSMKKLRAYKFNWYTY